MTQKIKVRKFGGSLGFTISKSVAEKMAIEEGDELFVSVGDDGLSITPYDPEFADALEDARSFMKSHRDAFKELAK